jgi:hypothetical protein
MMLAANIAIGVGAILLVLGIFWPRRNPKRLLKLKTGDVVTMDNKKFRVGVVLSNSGVESYELIELHEEEII